MLHALLPALLFVTPALCSEAQPHFSWPAGSFTSARAQGIEVVSFARVRAGGAAFTLALPGSSFLLGRRKGSAAVSDAGRWPEQQVGLLLPVLQGGVVIGEAGAGQGCEVASRGRDLGGPIASDVKIDARTGWAFEVIDRQTDEVLMRF
jgi:hypothetical protein